MTPSAPPQAAHNALDRLHDEELQQRRSGSNPRPIEVIVVGINGSQASEVALEWAITLASASGAKVHIVTALGAPAFDHGLLGRAAPLGTSLSNWRELVDEEHRSAERLLRQASRKINPARISAHTEVLVGRPAGRMSTYAQEVDADLVIVGGHRATPWQRIVLGSVTDGVRHKAPCSVLIARNPPRSGRILVATDASRYSHEALAAGIDIAKALQVETDVIHVVPNPSTHSLDAMAQSESRYVRLAAADRTHVSNIAVEKDCPLQHELLFGEPREVIIQYAAKNQHDLIVMGTRGLSGMRAMMAGSVSEPVSRHADTNVLLYKQPTR